MDQDRTSFYGSYLFRYIGSGTLSLVDGSKFTCSFELGQLSDGKLLLICTLPPNAPWFTIQVSSFSGHTSEGYAIRTTRGSIIETPYLPELPSDGEHAVFASFLVQEVEVVLAEGVEPAYLSYGMTNFQFRPRDHFYLRALGDSKVMAVRLPLEHQVEAVAIRPLPDYERRMERVRAVRSVDVTCEAQCRTRPTVGRDALETALDDLCYVLSFARGTKIDWVYCNRHNRDGSVISRMHSARITKPYASHSVIDPGDVAGQTQAFINQCLPVYQAKKRSLGLNTGLIDSFLDAKLEEDWLQVRGIKVVVAAEMLKSAFLRSPTNPVADTLVSKKQFGQLKEDVKDALSALVYAHGFPSDVAAKMAEKLSELNRRSFREIFERICEDIGLDAAGDLGRFIKARNNLVHTGYFFGHSNAGQEVEDSSRPYEEYLFILGFMDRVFLKLLGYSGPYEDRRTPGRVKVGFLP